MGWGGGDNQVDVLNTYFDCKKIIVPKEKKSIIRSIICCLVCLEVSLRKCFKVGEVVLHLRKIDATASPVTVGTGVVMSVGTKGA